MCAAYETTARFCLFGVVIFSRKASLISCREAFAPTPRTSRELMIVGIRTSEPPLAVYLKQYLLSSAAAAARHRASAARARCRAAACSAARAHSFQLGTSITYGDRVCCCCCCTVACTSTATQLIAPPICVKVSRGKGGGERRVGVDSLDLPPNLFRQLTSAAKEFSLTPTQHTSNLPWVLLFPAKLRK